MGRIDILINVAGGADRKLVVDMTAADWDHIVDMNLKSVFLVSQAFLPAMLKQHYGKIVNISSIYGSREMPPAPVRRGKKLGSRFYQVSGARTRPRLT